MAGEVAEIGIPHDALRLGWPEMEALSLDLADRVARSRRPIDKLLVLQRGGAFPGMVLAYRLGIMANRVLSASMSSYASGSMVRSAEHNVGQFPGAEQLRGQRILMVDEVCDSGHTLERVHNRLMYLGAAAVHSAVLHYKPDRSETGYVPDFYVEQTDRWIVYPWERYEAGVAESAADETAEFAVEAA